MAAFNDDFRVVYDRQLNALALDLKRTVTYAT